MKIDLHCHTLKCKNGDPEGRNVNKETFIKALKDKQVKIVAITNHNKFDRKQYDDFKVNDDIKVWPGIELDVEGSNGRGHCIIVSNPDGIDKFDAFVNSITKDSTPDTFNIRIDDLVSNIKDLNVIVIAHYYNKSQALSDEDINFFIENLGQDTPFYLKPANLRSAGVMIAHNYDTLIGSDVRNWSKYYEYELPELKIEIDNFNHFLLLIKKDKEIIKTFMDKKFSETIHIDLFPNCKFDLNIYNDVNIFFGGKGTGKTEILKKLKEVYESRGSSTVSYYTAQDKSLKFESLINVKCEETEFTKLGLKDCKDLFDDLKEWKDILITTTSKYYQWIKSKNSKNFGFINAQFSVTILKNKLDYDLKKYKVIKDSIKSLTDINLSEYLDESKRLQLTLLLDELRKKSREKVVDQYCKYYSLILEKFTVEKMKTIFQSKTGNSTKPSSTGLSELFTNCNEVKVKTKEICDILESEQKRTRKKLGLLMDKGDIYLDCFISVNPSNFNSKTIFLNGAKSKMTNLKKVKESMKDVENNAFSNNITEKLPIMIDLFNKNEIESIKSFIGINSKICRDNGNDYTPSNGEQAMLILNSALIDDSKSVYILDEPEMSVGHKYVNDVIVPRIKELARQNKIIIISTHDANIALRTLPMQSVYRVDKGNDNYFTYIGSPFLDLMYDPTGTNTSIDWAKTSIETLEGGKDAFNERGITYGKARS